MKWKKKKRKRDREEEGREGEEEKEEERRKWTLRSYAIRKCIIRYFYADAMSDEKEARVALEHTN